MTGTLADGSIHVASLETGERAVLPSEYVREHVALGYALTIHKAQGKTAERAILLVDEKMSAAQLYVGMSRGRDENRAFVICSDDDPDAHVRRPASGALEVLARVLRHDEVDRSAHDVMRRNLARLDDPRLLADLHEVARWRIEQEAGPDRSAEIATLATARKRRRRARCSERHSSRRFAPRTRCASQNRASARVSANRSGPVCPVGSVARRGSLRVPSSTTHDGSTRREGASDERCENMGRRALVSRTRSRRRAVWCRSGKPRSPARRGSRSTRQRSAGSVTF